MTSFICPFSPSICNGSTCIFFSFINTSFRIDPVHFYPVSFIKVQKNVWFLPDFEFGRFWATSFVLTPSFSGISVQIFFFFFFFLLFTFWWFFTWKRNHSIHLPTVYYWSKLFFWHVRVNAVLCLFDWSVFFIHLHSWSSHGLLHINSTFRVNWCCHSFIRFFLVLFVASFFQFSLRICRQTMLHLQTNIARSKWSALARSFKCQPGL